MFDKVKKSLHLTFDPFLDLFRMSSAQRYPELLETARGAKQVTDIEAMMDRLRKFCAESEGRARALHVQRITLYKQIHTVSQHEYLVVTVKAKDHSPSLVVIERLKSQTENGRKEKRKPEIASLSEPSTSISESESSDRYFQRNLANDVMRGINKLKSERDDVRVMTLDFHEQPPLFYYQLVVLAHAVHLDNEHYMLLQRNCYWYASVVCGVLRKQFPNVEIWQSEEYTPHTYYGIDSASWQAAVDDTHLSFWKKVQDFETEIVGKMERMGNELRKKDAENQQMKEALEIQRKRHEDDVKKREEAVRDAQKQREEDAKKHEKEMAEALRRQKEQMLKDFEEQLKKQKESEEKRKRK